MTISRSAVWQSALLVFFAMSLSGQITENPVKVAKVPASLRPVEHPEGIDISGQLIDADTGKYLAKSNLGLEITPVRTGASQFECATAVSSGEARVIWTQTDENGFFLPTHLEPGTYKIRFRLVEGSHPGAEIGCEIVMSKLPAWWRSRVLYRYTIQFTNRFRDVIATINADRPCQQWIRALPFVPELPYVLTSGKVMWLNEDGSPVRDSELVLEQFVETRIMAFERPKVRVKTDQSGMADMSEVFRRLVHRDLPGKVVTVDIAEGTFKGLKLKIQGAGDDSSQTVKVKEWMYMNQRLWAAEIE